MNYSLDTLRRKIQVTRAELDSASGQVAALTKRLAQAKEDLAHWSEAQGVLQTAGKAVQTLVHTQVAEVVTRCLQTVYGGDLEFRIAFENKRGRTEARLYFLKDGNEIDPVEAGGLGWLEVAAFALRLAVLKLHSPPLAQVLILDESFRFLDADAKPRMAELIMRLAEQMQVQIILTTHDADFQIGKVIELT